MTPDDLDALLLIDETCDDVGCECCALWSAHNGQMRAALREAWRHRDDYRALRDREHDRRAFWERQCLDREVERDEARAAVALARESVEWASAEVKKAGRQRDEARAALDRVRALCDDYRDDIIVPAMVRDAIDGGAP